jgi:hypothetical protein
MATTVTITAQTAIESTRQALTEAFATGKSQGMFRLGHAVINDVIDTCEDLFPLIRDDWAPEDKASSPYYNATCFLIGEVLRRASDAAAARGGDREKVIDGMAHGLNCAVALTANDLRNGGDGQ